MITDRNPKPPPTFTNEVDGGRSAGQASRLFTTTMAATKIAVTIPAK